LRPWHWLWVNQLKTGNLIFEMTFVGDDASAGRFQDALDYMERNWRDADDGWSDGNDGWGYNVYPASYQAMYCVMKGLEYSRVDLLDTDGDGVRDNDWFNQEPPASPAQDFASVLVAQQNPDGSWPGNCAWGDSVLCTTWALLTLEKTVPPLPVAVDIHPTSCPNPLNVGKGGVVPVAILGTEDFDVSEVDPASIRLEEVSPLRWAWDDVATPFEPYLGKEDCFADCNEEGPDGYMDLTLKFDARELVAALDEVEDGDCVVVSLGGSLVEGRAMVGEDVVWIKKKGK
jgi:hypothetical protein